MTPEQMQKEVQAATQRMTDRLVELGFARFHLTDEKRNTGWIDWTGDGIALQNFMKQIFNVPKVRFNQIPAPEIIALTYLLLGTKPVQDASK
jgi:hypothetical protein